MPLRRSHAEAETGARGALASRSTPAFDLATYGDSVECTAWPAFLHDEFPQYEAFWQVFVVELTDRVREPFSIRFRPQSELDAINRPEWHVAVAQLHYTTLLHLVRVFELRRRRIRDRDSFIEAIVRLHAATDAAFELLGRCLIDGGVSDPWDEAKGKKVRERWIGERKPPLSHVRHYRNALLHGRVRPEHEVMIGSPDDDWQTKVAFYPTFAKMPSALDWRKASIDDAEPADHLVDQAWVEVLDYLRATWETELLPWARERFKAPDVPLSLSATYLRDATAARSASASTPPEYHGGSATRSETYARPTDAVKPE